MDTKKLLSLAGMCRRAGGIVPGADAALGAASRAAVLVLSAGASERTKKQIRDKAKSRAVPLLEADADCDAIGHALGLVSPCAVFAVLRRGPYAAIVEAARDGKEQE